MKKVITNSVIEAYEKNAPSVVAIIKRLLLGGMTPKQVEDFARNRHSPNPEAWYLIAEKYKK